jgi:hypothetical protein
MTAAPWQPIWVDILSPWGLWPFIAAAHAWLISAFTYVGTLLDGWVRNNAAQDAHTECSRGQGSTRRFLAAASRSLLFDLAV